MDIARRRHAKLLAMIGAQQPFADAGDVDAQAGVLNLKAQLSSAAEAISNLKSPTDQVKLYSKALVARQKELAAAEVALVEWRTSLEGLEASVRHHKHEVDKITLQLAKATSLTAPTNTSQFIVDAASMASLAELKQTFNNTNVTTCIT